MKSLWHILVLVLICSLPLAGCGGGGAPGSTDSLQTDVVIESVFLEISDGDEVTRDIDMNVHLCPPDFTTAEEGLFMATATLKIQASRLNPNIDYDPFPASIESCTVTFRKAPEDPAGPVIEQMTVYPNCSLINGTIDCEIGFLDIQRKREWWRMIINGANVPAERPTHYIGRVQCRYTTRYGKTGSFQSEADVWLSDWEKC